MIQPQLNHAQQNRVHIYYFSRVSCQKGPTRHAYAWQIGPFWQDALDLWGIYGTWEFTIRLQLLTSPCNIR